MGGSERGGQCSEECTIGEGDLLSPYHSKHGLIDSSGSIEIYHYYDDDENENNDEDNENIGKDDYPDGTIHPVILFATTHPDPFQIIHFFHLPPSLTLGLSG